VTVFRSLKGTGKSAVTNAWLLEASSRTEGTGYIPLIINYSARTTAKQTQDGIMVKMDRRRKGIYGPPVGKRCIARVHTEIKVPLKPKCPQE